MSSSGSALEVSQDLKPSFIECENRFLNFEDFLLLVQIPTLQQVISQT
jgi:hypothetical protein